VVLVVSQLVDALCTQAVAQVVDLGTRLAHPRSISIAMPSHSPSRVARAPLQARTEALRPVLVVVAQVVAANQVVAQVGAVDTRREH
jgi:hypothetical protein